MSAQRTRTVVDVTIGANALLDLSALTGLNMVNRQAIVVVKEVPAGNSVRVYGSIKGGPSLSDWCELALFVVPGFWQQESTKLMWPYLAVKNSGPADVVVDIATQQVYNTMSERPTIA